MLYECRLCGTVVKRNGKPDECPACGTNSEHGRPQFARIDDVDELLS